MQSLLSYKPHLPDAIPEFPSTLLPRGVVASSALRVYWYIAFERQNMFFRRMSGCEGSITLDPILSRHRFTNAYRAIDRTSQFLIGDVFYDRETGRPLYCDAESTVLRMLLFKTFNSIDTWRYLSEHFGSVSARNFDPEKLSDLLDDRMARKHAVYNAAYIVPPNPKISANSKHRGHLRGISEVLSGGITDRLVSAGSLKRVYDVFAEMDGVGPFIGMQWAIDFGYSHLGDTVDENSFIVSGPGARSGIKKCFESTGSLTNEEVIALMQDIQHDAFSRLYLDFKGLFGRELKLIDCQNLFCEVDKYCRKYLPRIEGIGSRTSIKQIYYRNPDPISLFFPPHWGINIEHVSGHQNPGRPRAQST